MAIISAQGTIFTFDSQTVGGIVSYSGFDGAAADKDRTVLASTVKTFAPGLKNSGEFTLEVFRDNDDAGQAAILTALGAQSIETCVLTLPTSTANVGTFSAYVKSISSNGTVDGDVKGTIKFMITSDVVWT